MKYYDVLTPENTRNMTWHGAQSSAENMSIIPHALRMVPESQR